jgi:hypothetical protein
LHSYRHLKKEHASVQVGYVNLDFMEPGSEPGGNGRCDCILSEWDTVDNLVAADADRSGPSREMLTAYGNLLAYRTMERTELVNDRGTKRRADIRHTGPLDPFAHGSVTE